ncbi:MAG: beta-N-acetylhexosaminidase [Devosia sp.]
MTATLSTTWHPAAEGEAARYTLTLRNGGSEPLRDFRLCVSGPARIDPDDTVEGGRLAKLLSNHAELAPPAGFVLAPGDSWSVTVSGANTIVRHWTDGATGAYLALDGRIIPVVAAPLLAPRDNAVRVKGTAPYPVPVRTSVDLSIVPWPNAAATSGAQPVPPGLDVIADTAAGTRAAAAFTDLVAALFPAEGLVRPRAEGGMLVRLIETPGVGPEAHDIAFATGTATVFASTSTGLLYGLITLGQIVRGAKSHPANFVFPAAGTITDAPAYRWRGSHLDVARQFYSSAEVGQFLNVLAWNKLNRLHWHLSDDEAWRVEIDAYPALTDVGAWRGHGLAIPPLLGSGPQPVGGYYRKAAIRALVAQAERLGITILPEIDIPGHCFAMLQAIPELRDPAETGEYHSVQGFANNCINPASETTFEVLGKIFDELVELFPARIIHIGADEVPLGAWSGSPLALERLTQLAGPEMAAAHAARNGKKSNHGGADDIEGTGTAVLQAEFLARVQQMLAERGCITGGWEEAAHGDVIDKAQSYLVGWRDMEVSAELAGRGYAIVVAPGQRYYLDMANSAAWSEPGAGWAGWSGPRETYEFDPVAGWTDAQKANLLGVQACIWSEPMTDRAVFDRLVFPRLSAIAETGWTAQGSRSWTRFSALCGLMPILYGNWQSEVVRAAE